MNKNKLRKLENASRLARIYSLMSIYCAKSGHPGGVLSCIDLVVYLYMYRFKIKSIAQFKKKNRDRLILSKGHSVPALYSTLAVLKAIDYKKVLKLRKIDSPYQGHPCRVKTPWVEASTGSLGQGFSFSIGQALALKHTKKPNRVFVVLGDGEMQEGQIWEGLMFAAQHKLDNVTAILDFNKLQSDDFNKNIINIEPLRQKIKSFNWDVIEIDGHSFNDIDSAISKTSKNEKPLFIIAHTVKGKGVSFMENKPLWHGSVKMTIDQITSSLMELGANKKLIDDCINYE